MFDFPGSRLRGALLLAVFAAASAVSVASDDLIGQIVCSQCWYEADRPAVPYGNAGDLACAARCAKAGIPTALAVRAADGSFGLLLLRGDAPPGISSWLDVTGRFARVSGEIDIVGDEKTLRVATVELLDTSAWSVPGADDATRPALEWSDLRGRTVSLDDYRGRIVVLNFWATWCAPCREEMPDLARIQKDYAVFGVQVVGAAADGAEQAGAVLEYARAGRVNFPVLLGATTEQMQALGLGVALPATVVIDEDGHVVVRTDGIIDRRALARTLDRMLAGAGESRASGDHAHRHGARASAGLAPADASLVPS